MGADVATTNRNNGRHVTASTTLRQPLDAEGPTLRIQTRLACHQRRDSLAHESISAQGGMQNDLGKPRQEMVTHFRVKVAEVLET